MYIIDRCDMDFIQNLKNLKQHSLYILTGSEYFHYKQRIYIGQTQDASVRIQQHLSKDWWTSVIVFNCQNEPLFDRTTVQYLEYITIKNVISCGECQLMENCQIPQEPYTDKKEYIYNVYDNIKILLEFAGYRWLKNQVYNLNECYSKKNNIASRIAREITRTVDEPDDYEEKLVTYILNYGSYYAEAIILDSGKVMILPVSRLNVNGDYDILCKYDDSYDWLSGYLKKDIICDSLEDAAYIICQDRNAKWTESVKYI